MTISGLRAAGVREEAISIIPDEQDAIAAALNNGEPGDLLLIFADSLARSWKQITKFKPAGSISPPVPVQMPQPALRESNRKVAEGNPLAGEGNAPAFSLEGLIRDERGVRLAPEAED
jgi:cyanophycin synthetase